MAISKELLDILCCPETKEPVALIDEDMLKKINMAIEAGKAFKRNGEPVRDLIDAGLLRQDGKYLYPIREEIPIMLIEEAIDMNTVS
jgi:uncharacterized protein YbaR (Trm112 family)